MSKLIVGNEVSTEIRNGNLNGNKVSIHMKDGYKIDSCVIENVGQKIAMVSHRKDKEGVIISDIDYIVRLSKAAPSSTTVRKPSTGKTKKEIALELHKQYPNEARKHVIEMLVEQAGMSKAGASTYHQNIWRAK